MSGADGCGASSRHAQSRVDHNHRLVRRSCGAIADVDCANGVAPCPTPSDDGGFVTDEAEVVY